MGCRSWGQSAAWTLGLPTEWFEDRDGFPALAGQQISGVEHVVSWVMDTDAEVDGEGTFGNVVGVQGLFESERHSLTIRELVEDVALLCRRSTEGLIGQCN